METEKQQLILPGFVNGLIMPPTRQVVFSIRTRWSCEAQMQVPPDEVLELVDVLPDRHDGRGSRGVAQHQGLRKVSLSSVAAHLKPREFGQRRR